MEYREEEKGGEGVGEWNEGRRRKGEREEESGVEGGGDRWRGRRRLKYSRGRRRKVEREEEIEVEGGGERWRGRRTERGDKEYSFSPPYIDANLSGYKCTCSERVHLYPQV